jgi:hypothetical protein
MPKKKSAASFLQRLGQPEVVHVIGRPGEQDRVEVLAPPAAEQAPRLEQRDAQSTFSILHGVITLAVRLLTCLFVQGSGWQHVQHLLWHQRPWRRIL